MVGELVLVRVSVGTENVEAVVPHVGQSRIVAVVDVPVEAHEVLLVLVRQAGDLGARLPAILVGRDVADPVELGLRYTEYRSAALLVAGTTVEQVRGFPILVGGEEEQRVLDDRAADREAVARVVELAGRQIVTFELVTLQVNVAVAGEHRAVELVRA